MIDHRILQDIIPILRAHGVKTFKAEGLEVEFHVEQKATTPGMATIGIPQVGQDQESDQSMQNLVNAVKKQEEALPADLRADALMDQDKILNWSSPDQKPFEQDQELPLTGEQPL